MSVFTLNCDDSKYSKKYVFIVGVNYHGIIIINSFLPKCTLYVLEQFRKIYEYRNENQSAVIERLK
jgi:hypothetical protein